MLELMVVVTLVAILAAITLPSFASDFASNDDAKIQKSNYGR